MLRIRKRWQRAVAKDYETSEVKNLVHVELRGSVKRHCVELGS